MRVIILLVLLPSFYFSQAWVKLPDFPGTKRDDGTAVVVNNKAYFGTGLQEGWTSTVDFYCLDLTTKNWSTIANMPNGTERQYARAFKGNNGFYVFGGDGPTGALNNLFKYDIATNTWSLMANKPGAGLIGPACFEFGNKVIIAGGKTSTAGVNSAEVWEYDLSNNSWTQKNNFPYTPRWHACTAVINGNGYMVFGQAPNDSCGTEFYTYNPSNDTWQQLSDIPIPKGRSYARMEALSNRLVLFGGVNCYGEHYKDMWHYNFSTQIWKQNIDLPSFERRGGMSCTDGKHLYYACGYSPIEGRLKEVWRTDIPLSIKNFEEQNALKLYPNPAQYKLHVMVDNIETSTLHINFTSVFGNKMEFASNKIKVENGEMIIDVSELNSGVYLLSLETESGQIGAAKVIIK